MELPALVRPRSLGWAGRLTWASVCQSQLTGVVVPSSFSPEEERYGMETQNGEERRAPSLPTPWPHTQCPGPACRRQCESSGGNHLLPSPPSTRDTDTDASLGPGRAAPNVRVWFLLFISLQDNKQWEPLDCFWVGAGLSALSLCRFLPKHRGVLIYSPCVICPVTGHTFAFTSVSLLPDFFFSEVNFLLSCNTRAGKRTPGWVFA